MFEDANRQLRISLLHEILEIYRPVADNKYLKLPYV